MNVVLDADVVIAALDATDARHEAAKAHFQEWHERGDARLLSVVNLTEVLVGPARDRELLRRARRAIDLLGIAVRRPFEAVAVDAARLRGAHPISIPDAYCLATARAAGAAVASFDQRLLRAAASERVQAAIDAPR